jgi:type II secretory pathway pseudopilin PulG
MEGLGALFSGFAGSLPGGIQLGQRQQALQQEQQKMEAEIRAQQAAAAHAAQQQKLEEFSKLTAFYKEVPESLKKDNWPTIAKKTNALFGTTFDPNKYPDEAGPIFRDADAVLETYKAGRRSFGDTMTLLTQLEAKLAASGEKDGANQIHSMIGGLTGAQEQKVRAQENGTREPSGARYVSEFQTRDLLKYGGFTDQQIADGQRAGKIPRQFTVNEASIYAAAHKPATGKGKFDLSAFRSGTPAGGVNQAKSSLLGDIFGGGESQ